MSTSKIFNRIRILHRLLFLIFSSSLDIAKICFVVLAFPFKAQMIPDYCKIVEESLEIYQLGVLLLFLPSVARK